MGWMWIFLDKCSMGSVGITFISPKIIESETRFIKLELKKKKKKIQSFVYLFYLELSWVLRNLFGF